MSILQPPLRPTPKVLNDQGNDLDRNFKAILDRYYLRKVENGGFYAEDVTRTVAIAAVHTFYPVMGSMTCGHCPDALMFQNARELVCRLRGWYAFVWSMTSASRVGDNTIEGGVMVNSVGLPSTNNATRAKENGVAYSVSGGGPAFQLAPGDIIRLCVEVETTAPCTLTVTHANLRLEKLE